MRHVILAVLGMFMLNCPAGAVLIDFNDGIEKANIGTFYSPLSVTFSGATWQDNFGLVGFSGHLGLGSTNSGAYNWDSTTPVVATFSSAVNAVSLGVLDLGENGFVMNAYDSTVGGTLVSTTSKFGIGFGNNNFQTLGVVAPSIRRVEFYQAQHISVDGIVVEDFRFSFATPVPEPESYAMLLAGLGVMGFAARRRKTSVVARA